MDPVGTLILFLVVFPLAAGAVLLVIRRRSWGAWPQRIFAAVIVAAAVALGVLAIGKQPSYYDFDLPAALQYAPFALELMLLAYAAWRSFVYRKWLPILLLAVQITLVCYAEFCLPEEALRSRVFFLDQLSLTMALIVGVIGGLIAVFTVSYMRDYHAHHKEIKDRRPVYSFLLFVFLGSMFGLVFSNDLKYFGMFWEGTTICSFLMIGYPRTPEPVTNAFRALTWNLLGGIALTAGAVVMAGSLHIRDMDILLALETRHSLTRLVAVLFAVAGMVKSAQMPFSPWLLGAMVAPTPTSALLHSSTMVKAGVYLVIRVMPALAGTLMANCVALMGTLTFLLASVLAVAQQNAKKVLAYSTIANLGLIVACAGVGSFETIEAAVLLIIFHAVAKSLLFLCVGAVEHRIDSRDIEDMDWLIVKMPPVAGAMVIGIAGMFLPPLGMLISKWVVLGAFVDSHMAISPLLILALAFGSAFNVFFWMKWLGKIISPPLAQGSPKESIPGEQTVMLWTLAVLTVATCLCFPLISRYLIQPFVNSAYISRLAEPNYVILVIMLLIMVVLPASLLFTRKRARRMTPYLSGRNAEDPIRFRDTFNAPQEIALKNYYFADFIPEGRILLWGGIGSAVLMAVAILGCVV